MIDPRADTEYFARARERDQARAIARELLEVARSCRRLDVAMPGRLRRIIAAAEEQMARWEDPA